MEGIRFWSQVKTVTQRWPGTENIGDQAFIIPTMSWVGAGQAAQALQARRAATCPRMTQRRIPPGGCSP